MLDNAVNLARDWALARGDDTLILVVADHNHPISLIGTIDDDMTEAPKAPLRERVRRLRQGGISPTIRLPTRRDTRRMSMSAGRLAIFPPAPRLL
jgi:alkaline phosphatase